MRMRMWVAAAAIGLCALAFYANGLGGPFIGLDDKQSIRDNPHIRQVWPLSEAFSLPLWTSSGVGDSEDKRAAIARRPLLSLSFALNYQLSGLDPRGYHAVNLLIHVLAALALFGILRRMLASAHAGSAGVSGGWTDRHADHLALAATLLWLVHPLQTESVTFIIQRAEALAGLFVLLTLYCALRSFAGTERRGVWEAAAIAACAAGMTVKETAIVAPLLVLLYDRVFRCSSLAECLRRGPGLYTGLLLTMLIAPALASGGRGDFRPGDTAAYALAQPRVILRYLRLTLWPDPLHVYVNTRAYDVRSASEVIMPALVLVALVATTLWALAKKPLAGFLGAWFFLMLGPTSSVLAISDVIQEHRMYLALAAPVTLAVLAGDGVLHGVAARTGERPARLLGAGVLALLVLALGARTHARNRDYGSEFATVYTGDLLEAYTVLIDHYASDPALLSAEARNARALLASPDPDPRDATFAHFVLAFDHQERGETDAAARELERVLAVEPQFAYAHRQLGEILRDREDLDGAVEHLEQALRIAPSSVFAHKELAVVLKERGDLAGARAQLDEALRRKPDFAEAYYELGVLAAEQDDTERAIAEFSRAIEHRPDFAEAHYELAQVLEESGDDEQAAEHLAKAVRADSSMTLARLKLARRFAEHEQLRSATRQLRRAVRADSGFAEGYFELGLVLMQRGKTDAAVHALRRSLREFARGSDTSLRPQSEREELARARKALGMSLGRIGRLQRAKQQLTRALRLDPDYAQAHAELAVVLRLRGDFSSAIEHLKKAIRHEPDDAGAYNELGWILSQQGDLRAAARYLERAVEIRGDFTEAQQRLAEVRARIAAAEPAKTEERP